jgi:tetratricopeptide (TPR) repeat protein
MNGLGQDLQTLEDSNLVRLLKPQPELEYVFRHTLMQETAYKSLLRSERAELHNLVGEALERQFPGGRDDMAGLLAHHFEEADQDEKAIDYYELAGKRAREHYANQEASEYYGRALALARDIGDVYRQPSLHRARGQMFEILGDFEKSRSEHEAALASAIELGQSAGVWQANIDLGMLWASKDYQKTQEYYEEALRVAREMGDQAILGHTLNRIGNLEVNISSPLVSEARHQEALKIFQALGDEKGLAETLDYLSMTYELAGKSAEQQEYGQRAARLFLKQGDELHLASSLSGAGLRGANLVTMQLSNTEEHFDPILRDAIQGCRLADNIGWRSGSAFARISMAAIYGLAGEFGEAVSLCHQAIELAEDIGHVQWSLAGRSMLGATLLQMLNPEDAIGHLKSAHEIAKRANSVHWTDTVAGFLTSAWVDLREYEEAQMLLESTWPKAERPRSQSEGSMWLAKAQLKLAQGDYDSSLKLVQELYDSLVDRRVNRPVPMLGLVQADCYFAKGMPALAEEILTSSLAVSKTQGASAVSWQIQGLLAEVQRKLGLPEASAQSLDSAQRVVDDLAGTIQDPRLEHIFRRRANDRLRS